VLVSRIPDKDRIGNSGIGVDRHSFAIRLIVIAWINQVWWRLVLKAKGASVTPGGGVAARVDGLDAPKDILSKCHSLPPVRLGVGSGIVECFVGNWPLEAIAPTDLDAVTFGPGDGGPTEVGISAPAL